jgi:hypothetical protein
MEREEFLHALWLQLPALQEGLYTTTGERVSVLNTGTYNHNAGPDFLNAHVEIEGVHWAGDVEMHIHSSDWYLHNHDSDPAYDAVILHVVAENDRPIVRTHSQRILTTVVFPHLDIYERYQATLCQNTNLPRCDSRLAKLTTSEQNIWFKQLLTERLESRAQQIEQDRTACELDWEEAFYRSMARSLGLKVNAEPMHRLARSIPFKNLYKVRDSRFAIEAILHGQSGLLQLVPKNECDDYTLELLDEYNYHATKFKLAPLGELGWKFLRLRPTVFPSIRISQLAGLLVQKEHLLSSLLESETLGEIEQILAVDADFYWNSHYKFSQTSRNTQTKKLGKTSLQTLLLNSVLPFRYAYSKSLGNEQCITSTLTLYHKLPPEQNSIIRNYSDAGLHIDSAATSQAILELHKNYCLRNRCYLCPAWRART